MATLIWNRNREKKNYGILSIWDVTLFVTEISLLLLNIYIIPFLCDILYKAKLLVIEKNNIENKTLK